MESADRIKDTDQQLRRIEQLEAELAKANAEVDALGGDLSKWITACNESRMGIVLPMPPLVKALHDRLTQLEAENTELKQKLSGYEAEKVLSEKLPIISDNSTAIRAE
jgi:cell division protein FtsB